MSEENKEKMEISLNSNLKTKGKPVMIIVWSGVSFFECPCDRGILSRADCATDFRWSITIRSKTSFNNSSSEKVIYVLLFYPRIVTLIYSQLMHFMNWIESVWEEGKVGGLVFINNAMKAWLVG